MRRTMLGVCLISALGLAHEAKAGFISEFSTNTTATQSISSPFYPGGPITITSRGPQHFVINTNTGIASVTSFFQGDDLPNPLGPGSLRYNAYNTTTAGTVTQTAPGVYTITFELLFELQVTSGSLAGLIVETHDAAKFEASNLGNFPFLPGTAFLDPVKPDAVNLYVKDAFGPLAAGSLFGQDFDRTVTINSIVPEPSSLALALMGVGLGGVYVSRGRRLHGQHGAG